MKDSGWRRARRASRRWGLGAAALAGLSLAGGGASADGGGWSVETAAADLGIFRSLEIDAQGNASLAYRSSRNGTVYAVRSSSSWSLETVEPVDPSGQATPALSYDPSGRATLAYGWPRPDKRSKDRVVFATRGASGWAKEVVDEASSVPLVFALEHDASGAPCVVYRRAEKRGGTSLRFARRESGAWTAETIDTGGFPAASLSFDATGRPVVAYGMSAWDPNESTLAQLHVAVRGASGWSKEAVDSSSDGGGYGVSVATDPSGNLCVAHVTSVASARLRFVRSNGSAWDAEAVYGPGGLARAITLLVDGAGTARVGFTGLDPGGDTAAMVASRESSGSWTLDVVESSGFDLPIGHGPAFGMAVRNGLLSVAYNRDAGAVSLLALRYAEQVP